VKKILKMVGVAKKYNESPVAKQPTGEKKPISWETFQARYLSRDDAYTYEWVNGQVEKTKRSMDYKQVFILDNVLSFFEYLKFQQKVKGRLTNEVDTFFKGNHRRPDMCYLTEDQIRATKQGVIPVPSFVIEIISNTDKMKRAQEKMLDYWNANVDIIWHIFPDIQMVHVYHGKKMVVCMGDEICSASPVLTDFEMTVNEIFK
jgi:Uma2 family endonuclease